MQRTALLAVSRLARLSVRRVESAARERSVQQAGYCAWQSQFGSVRQFHISRPTRAAEGGTFLDRGAATARILAVVKNFEKVDPTKVTDKASFKDDLSLDSLDAVEVVMAIEDEFTIEIPDNEADKILTVSDAVNFIIAHPAAK